MQRVREGELLLMDAGCELHGYSSDVSRTWPVSGTFSVQQREVYEIVLDTHRCAAVRLTCMMQEQGPNPGP
jgi:Xaa-Pro aminopeptidase